MLTGQYLLESQQQGMQAAQLLVGAVLASTLLGEAAMCCFTKLPRQSAPWVTQEVLA